MFVNVRCCEMRALASNQSKCKSDCLKACRLMKVSDHGSNILKICNTNRNTNSPFDFGRERSFILCTTIVNGVYITTVSNHQYDLG